jgi:N-hydroxyarylamine O-acetyltransferase
MISDLSWIESYFERIGYTGGREVSYETLSGIHTNHIASMPYENLDTFIGKRLSLDLEDLIQKMLVERRGGMCTEHNTFLCHVLTSLGFTVTRIISKFLFLVLKGSEVATMHTILKVDLDNKQYLVDVGSGSFSPPHPLEIGYESELVYPNNPPKRLLTCINNTYAYQYLIRGKWVDIFVGNLEERFGIDWEVSFWYGSTCPRSKYWYSIILERVLKDQIISFKDNYLKHKFLDGSFTSKTLTTREKLLEALSEHFGIFLPLDTKFEKDGKTWPRESESTIQPF